MVIHPLAGGFAVLFLNDLKDLGMFPKVLLGTTGNAPASLLRYARKEAYPLALACSPLLSLEFAPLSSYKPFAFEPF